MLVGLRMVVDRHLIKVNGGAREHLGEKSLVDIVIEILDGDFNFGRLTDVVPVDGESTKRMNSSKLASDSLRTSKTHLGTGRSVGS